MLKFNTGNGIVKRLCFSVLILCLIVLYLQNKIFCHIFAPSFATAIECEFSWVVLKSRKSARVIDSFITRSCLIL